MPTTADIITALAHRYCWDRLSVPPSDDAVIRRVMDHGFWEDRLLLERTFPRAQLVQALQSAPAGSLSPRSWSFWYYRLELIAPGDEPPPMPVRQIISTSRP
jgi:transposase